MGGASLCHLACSGGVFLAASAKYFFAKCVAATLNSQSRGRLGGGGGGGGVVDRREEGRKEQGRGRENENTPSLPTPSLPTFTEIKHDAS